MEENPKNLSKFAKRMQELSGVNNAKDKNSLLNENYMENASSKSSLDEILAVSPEGSIVDDTETNERTDKESYELARKLISSEFESFDFNPIEYVDSMGWDSFKRDYVQLKGKLTFDSNDINDLKRIIYPRLRYLPAYSEKTESVVDDSQVNDFLNNLISKKINEYFDKKEDHKGDGINEQVLVGPGNRHAKFYIGEKVRVSDLSGVDSNKEATVVDKGVIKTNGRGVPINISGAYKPVDWTKEVAIQFEDGTYTTMYKNRLRKEEDVKINEELSVSAEGELEEKDNIKEIKENPDSQTLYLTLTPYEYFQHNGSQKVFVDRNDEYPDQLKKLIKSYDIDGNVVDSDFVSRFQKIGKPFSCSYVVSNNLNDEQKNILKKEAIKKCIMGLKNVKHTHRPVENRTSMELHENKANILQTTNNSNSITPAQIKALTEEIAKINKKIDLRNPAISASQEPLIESLLNTIKIKERSLNVEHINKQKHISHQTENELAKMKRLMGYQSPLFNKENK